MAMGSVCRSCAKVHWGWWRRGLCYSCYANPLIREQFPSTSKHARQGVGGANLLVLSPPDATAAPPGSEAKIRVMEERVRLGYSCFHPDDAGMTMLDEEAA